MPEMCSPYVKYIDIRTSPLTMGETLEAVERLKQEHPEQEIFIDGDMFAVVGRTKGATA